MPFTTQFAELDIGTPELLIILLIVFLLFGSKKLPELSKSIGQSIKEIKGGISDATEIKKEVTTQVTQAKKAWHNTEDASRLADQAKIAKP